MSALKVAIVGGSGVVGSTLGGKLAAKGHRVVLATRDPASAKTAEAVERAKKLAGSGSAGVSTGSADDAIDGADVVILAPPSDTTTEPEKIKALAASIASHVKGKVVIDVTNPVKFGPAGPELTISGGTSAGEIFAAALPDAKVSKAFNSVGVKVMADTNFKDGPADGLFAGPAETEAIVARIVGDVGFHPQYVGPIREARTLEALCELWVRRAYAYGKGEGWAWGFRERA